MNRSTEYQQLKNAAETVADVLTDYLNSDIGFNEPDERSQAAMSSLDALEKILSES